MLKDLDNWIIFVFMKWKVKDASLEKTGMLQEKYSLDRVSARILAARGRTETSDLKFFLEKDISFLNNPFLFEDMESFCDRIFSAVEDGEKVRVFGDRDVDGITSTALMVTELKSMGLDVSWKVPLGNEPYGLTVENIDKAVEEGISLAITVDCGISAISEIAYARSKGLDFIVTDHHIAPQDIPAAVAIINPKVEGCGYPFEGLAGVGVVAKCIWALRFAKTPMYRSPVILLHAMPGNSTVIIEACKVENMIVTDRVSEEVVPGLLPSFDSRLLRFLDCNLPVLVLDEQTEKIQLRKAFPKAEIHLTDLRKNFDKYLAQTRGKSLFQLSTASRYAFYSQTRSELDALTGLFFALTRAMYPQLHKDYVTLMDLVAIGTVSDLMPMTDENLILVRNGLKQLEEASRLSLRPFLVHQKLFGKSLSSGDIGWQIAPQMNASGRMGRPDVAVNMLLCTDENSAQDLAMQLFQMNKERQDEGEKCWDRIMPSARQMYEKLGSKLVLVDDEKIPRGLAGILATRLQKTFRAPSVVITKVEENRCIGSMRSPKTFNCHNFLATFSDLFIDFGGHAFAGGFSILPENKDELLNRMAEQIDWMDFPDDSEDEIEIDAVLTQSEMTLELMQRVKRFEPFGEQNDAPVFMAEGASIEGLTRMSNSHIRFVMSYGSYKWPCVFWSAGDRVENNEFANGSKADIVFRMGMNSFRGQENVQLTVLDLKVR